MSLCPSTTIAFLCRASARLQSFSSLCGVAPACGVGLADACASVFPAPAPFRADTLNADAASAQTTTHTNRQTRRVIFITPSPLFGGNDSAQLRTGRTHYTL